MTATQHLSLPPKRLCLLRLSAIGDVCHMLSVVQRIQQHWPHTEITWVIGKTEATLLAETPGIEFIIFDKKQGRKAYYQLYGNLRQRSFDILLHMQTAFRASLASLCIKATHRIGFARPLAKDLQWLFTNTKLPYQQQRHVLENFHDFADFLGVPHEKPSWKIKHNESDQQWAKQIIAGKKTLLISPSASVASRNWHAAAYAAVARHAMEQHHLNVILCGGPTALERSLGQAIMQQGDNKFHNLIGQTNLKQLLALLSEATALIAPDTGPAHMATMVNTPVISLFANTNPARVCPYFSKELVVNRYPQAMQLHYKKNADTLPWGTRSHDPKLMDLITVDDVVEQLDKLMVRLKGRS